mmetsp:Transcript_11950/g.16553  ORF Transcript_11950/g.16553 Transcript_11950/m.16553 type:complete len:267 (-) Transcript_11950:375-1175(-)
MHGTTMILLFLRAILPSESISDPRAQQVAILFKRLHQSDQVKVALEELYQFAKANPDYDIEPHMKMVSKAFQSWIRRGFKRIEERKKNNGANAAAAGGGAAGNGSYQSAAAQYQERLRSLRARAAQIKGGSYGALSYGKSPPRAAGRESKSGAETKVATVIGSGLPQATPSDHRGAAGDIVSLRSRLTEMRRKARDVTTTFNTASAGGSENLPSQQNNTVASFKNNDMSGKDIVKKSTREGARISSSTSSGLESIRARLNSMRSRR